MIMLRKIEGFLKDCFQKIKNIILIINFFAIKYCNICCITLFKQNQMVSLKICGFNLLLSTPDNNLTIQKAIETAIDKSTN